MLNSNLTAILAPKTLSRRWTLCVLGLGLWLAAASGFASDAPNPFTVVPLSDSTYGELLQLENSGLLPAGASQGPLTRLEVAERVFKAEKKYQEIVVAQSDMEIPPPPSDNGASSTAPAPSSGNAAAPAASGGTTPATAPTPASTAVWANPDKVAAMERNLTSLQQAYQAELQLVKDEKKDLEDQVAKTENAQFDLWRAIQGITEYPNIAWHGLGRMYGISQQYYGDNTAVSFVPASNRFAWGFIDFIPEGVVSKELDWSAIVRYGAGTPGAVSPDMNFNNSLDTFFIRRLHVDLNPPWFSVTMGDFDESYTPLTMWNRDNLDLRYYPEMYKRIDDEMKYETFLNNEPNWPFRGIRWGTDIGWTDSDILQEFKVSTMADMIRNGFKDMINGGSYWGPDMFTDWILAGKGELKSKRWFLGGDMSLQLGLNAYGVMLTEPLNTDTPGTPYGQFTPSTWAHHYQIGSLKPTLDLGLGGDFSFGGALEAASATYQDDEQDPNKVLSDYSMLGGPYLRLGQSKLTFNYLYVGPDFFSPLAQTRQDAVTAVAGGGQLFLGNDIGPDLMTAPLRSQFFLNDVPRAGGIFSFYDRTQDNTFPYGLATPNREGFGFELDVKALEKEALKIPASVYFVQEISDNIVVNSLGTGYTPVDGTASAPAPQRNFTYVNVGPSFNLGPYIGTGDLEVGANIRYEQTTSSIGTLTSTWILGGIRAEFFPWWEASTSFGTDNVNGSEAGYGGSTLARYSYIFDNTDLGQYQIFTVNGTNESWRVSTSFKVNRNSTIYGDYDLTWGNAVPYIGTPPGTSGNLYNQYMGLTYEVQF
jgi:hypothetical protein